MKRLSYLALALTAPLLLAAPGASAAPTAPAVTGPTSVNGIPNVQWSGYSLVAAKGVVSQVYAKWNVPTVTSCGLSRSFAAEWVGLWGTLTQPSKQWLPQIGTVGNCGSPFGKPNYGAYWEVANGTGGYALIWDNTTRKWNPITDSGQNAEPLPRFTVNPGDTMEGEVDYLGSNKAGQREFEIDLWNKSNNDQFHADILTNNSPALGNIDNQGGAIVEAWTGGLFSIPILNLPYEQGLATYSPPVTFSSLGIKFSDGSTSYWENKLEMETLAAYALRELQHKGLIGQVAPGDQVAAVSGNGVSPGGSFTVTWKKS